MNLRHRAITMAPPIGLQFAPAITAQLLRTRRGVRRLVALGRQLWYARLTDRRLELRQHRHKFTMFLAWLDILNLAEHRAGEQLHRQRLQDRAIKAIARRRAGR